MYLQSQYIPKILWCIPKILLWAIIKFEKPFDFHPLFFKLFSSHLQLQTTVLGVQNSISKNLPAAFGATETSRFSLAKFSKTLFLCNPRSIWVLPKMNKHKVTHLSPTLSFATDLPN